MYEIDLHVDRPMYGNNKANLYMFADEFDNKSYRVWGL